ncbi:hypothetical protein K2173_006411 [Erythroxylum novogranatense]|uniref:Galactose oxidase n=1 Tax=Erythroxylum novogranatense TaxID=1862640 RepID=A0AAV8U4J6_9ROSI|nr:hypothetical protein K2173_006411 [Erythroxylum novogranatense]
MAIKNHFFLIFPFILFLSLLCSSNLAHAGSFFSAVTGGNWVVLQESIGISAMHMQLLKNSKVIIFDRTDFGPSNLSLPEAKCRFNDDAVKPKDCTAHSILYDIVSNTFRPLTLHTNTFCSSGTVDSYGNLVQTGGDRRGERVIRMFTTCDNDSCDWVELVSPLMNRRWYATDQILPDGRIIIVGGRRVFSYEFFPRNSSKWSNKTLPFLVQTRDSSQEENNLYPFLHLLPDGNLFIFANNRSILFDYTANRVIKEYPVMPGGDRRNYPSTGSSVLLPIQLGRGVEAEVMICGGAPARAHIKAVEERVFVEASRTCGRLKVTDPRPEWVMELMPMPRVMGDMLLLPSGDVLIINGAAHGTAGWDDARVPVYNPVLYLPDEDPTRRFVVLNRSKIARMYHSTAVLLPDGRILVGGSNPHPVYNFTAYPYPTELSLEAFRPHYLDAYYNDLRPSILTVETMVGRTVSFNQTFSLNFVLTTYRPRWGVSVVLITPSFTTHSFGMNQRMLVLNRLSVTQLSTYAYKVSVLGPTNANVAPPGYYMLFVVHVGIPSQAVWVQVM